MRGGERHGGREDQSFVVKQEPAHWLGLKMMTDSQLRRKARSPSSDEHPAQDSGLSLRVL